VSATPSASGGGGRFLARGHPAAERAIRRAVEDERPPHALLLEGPRGVGKTTLALDLAAGLLCLDSDPEVRPCRACASCRKVASDDHPDVHRLAPEGAGEQVRIGQVQQLASDLALTAHEGRFRVAIISAAHRLNQDAQNALLKTLEEPGPRTCLVLCADDSAPLLPTVLSRSTRLRLPALSVDALVDLLAELGHASPAQARALALTARGCPGLAIRLASRPEAVLARSRMSRTLLDLLAADCRARLAAAAPLVTEAAGLDAALRGGITTAGAKLEPAERRRAVLVVLEAWRDLGRDIAVSTQGAGAGVRDLDLLEEIRDVTPRVAPVALRRFLERLDGVRAAIEGYANPELALDTLLLAWAHVAPGRPDRDGAARGRAA
jgi:DNA polymerase-3 subunit delta'